MGLNKDLIKRRFVTVLNIISIVALIVLILTISIDTFKHDIYSTANMHSIYIRIQFWVCIYFLASLIIELMLTKDKESFLKRNIVFFLISLPYLNIFNLLHFHFPSEVSYLLRFIPLIRGGYALGFILITLNKRKLVGLFISYALIFVFLIYMYSLIFYVYEYKVNPMVNTYFDTLWWAWMNAVTIGCNIVAVTAVGKVLSVLVAFTGITMFPFFTVYIINMVQRIELAKVKTPIQKDAEEAKKKDSL